MIVMKGQSPPKLDAEENKATATEAKCNEDDMVYAV